MRKISQLPGSIADRMHKHLNDVPRSKIDEGAKVEREHTNNKHLQRLIALDHVLEDSNYYPKLKKMEKEAMVSGFLDELSGIIG